MKNVQLINLSNYYPNRTKKKKIKYNSQYANQRVCVDNYPLCVNDDQIYSDPYCKRMERYSIGNGGAGFICIEDDIDKIYVHNSKISTIPYQRDTSLMVLSHIVF